MPNCGECSKVIGVKGLKVMCNDCSKEFHANCLRMSKADIDCITADGLVWRCSNCAADRRKSMRLESDVIEGKTSLDDLMKVIQEIRDSQKVYEKGYNVAYEALNDRLEENTSVLKMQGEKMEKYFNLIEQLSTENKQLKQKIKVLEERLEESEQYSRCNAVEIHGIPQEANENVVDLVKCVGNALDMNISDTMIDACHRLGKKQNGSPPGIIVKFVRRLDKEEFLRRRRVKRTLSTRHMGRTDDRPVYVNESLSPARRKLLAMTRAVQREKNYKFLWVRNGKIFVRREENAAFTIVTSQDDLSKL